MAGRPILSAYLAEGVGDQRSQPHTVPCSLIPVPCSLIPALEVFAGFSGGEDVVFAGHPDVKGGQEEDADDQIGE